MEGKNSPWILEKVTTTSNTESQSASTAIDMDIWQRNAGRRKKRKPGNVSNMIEKNISPKITKKED